jgi:hypothetical protein
MVANPRAAQTSRVAANQIRRDARFINEHILAGIVEGLRVVPLPARGRDGRTVLFIGVYGFF